MQDPLSSLFQDSVAIHPGAPEPSRVDWLKLPAKAAVYLLVDQADDASERPLLLATVGDLRSALKRRLGDGPPPESPTTIPPPAPPRSKRIAYGHICSRVYFRRVDSAFSANWWYWRLARTLFPDRYKQLIPWRQSWWIALERPAPEIKNPTPFPRLRRTADLADPALAYAGPIRDRASAGKLIETAEDLFDLCRYHHELVQAPHGRPCAYKEMGKCPAPCDGSVPIPWYREQISRAWAFLTHHSRDAWRQGTLDAMRAAAARLEFETANRIKQRLTRAAALDTDAFSHLAPLESFAFLSLQPGKGKPWLEPWLIHGGSVECLPQVPYKDLPAAAQHLAAACQKIAAAPTHSLDTSQMEQVAIVCHHLFRGEQDHGLWLRAHTLAAQGPPAILAAAEQLRSRKVHKTLIEHSTESLPKPDPTPDPPPETLYHSRPRL